MQIENDCWWLLRWILTVAVIIILLLFLLKPSSPEIGFETIEQAELCQIEQSLNQFGAGIRLDSGQRYLWDGTRFCRGKDKTGALWIFVLTEPAPGTTKIEQYPIKEKKP